MLAVILCCLLVTPTFLVTEAVALRRSIKKGMPKNSAKPTGKRLSQSLPFNKEETPAHALSREIRETLKNTAPPPTHYCTPPGDASVVTYTLKMTELPPGLERKIIIYPIFSILCCFHFI